MNWTPRREAFRAILKGSSCIYPASVFDPLSARIAQDIGFEAAMFAGSIGSLAVLGAPDLIVLTLTEFAEQALRINRACSMPVVADADHGYGNALNVMRTVEELEAAGIAALTIEDTLLPRPFADGKTRPTSIEEGVGKMKAAVAARSDKSLVILARTGSIMMTGLDDTLARAQLAPDAIDKVFLTGGTSFVPAVRRLFERRFGADRLESGDELLSIANGLALIGERDDAAAWAT